MVTMRALRSANMGDGTTKVRRGSEFDVASDRRAEELEKRGLAHRVAKMEPPYLNKAEETLENKASAEGPLGSDGGRTGEATSGSSLPLGRRRPASRGARSEAED